MRGTFSVDGSPGERWDLAIDLLRRGEEMVSIGNLLLYRRDLAEGGGDGVVHVEICAGWQPSQLTEEIAKAEIDAGMRNLGALLADRDLAGLVEEHGLACDYVEDMDTGRVGLAKITRDGAVTWGHSFARSA